ncbi:hypothetical protein N9X64_00135 [bacterium]|nr:hypothetical protein [bacterium]
MSDSWKVPWSEYLVMITGIKDEVYSPHCFNLEAGMVVFRTKRERKLLEDVISWANDKVIPEREPTAGEPRKKKATVSKENEGPSIGQLILQHPTIITNLRSKNADYLQGLCPSCAAIGKDSDENHFWIHEESGGYGCVADCMTDGDLTRILVKTLSDAGVLQSDTPQKEQESETEPAVERTVLKERKKGVGWIEELSKRTNSRLVKNTDHHTVEHVLHEIYDMALRKADVHVYNRIETSKTTGKETITEVEVPDDDVRALWQAIIRHIVPSPVLGGSFEVSVLWDTMNINRTKQGEKYRRWNFPSDILILLGVLEKNGNTYTVRRAFR